MLKAITLLVVSFLALDVINFGSCRDRQKTNDPPVVDSQKNNSELKVVAEGSQSAVEEPFIAVIRDEKTYAGLRKIESQLPKVDPEFFSLNVAVAVFLGTRNTGGYQIEITRDAGRIRVAEKAPPKDAMTIQVLTSPFKVVSFQPNGSTAVEVAADQTFRGRQAVYRVTNGTFSTSGGFTGRTESFQLKGSLEFTRLGELVTVGFDLTSSGASRDRGLRGFATGLVTKNEISIDRLSHGSLMDPPSGELSVTGKFLEKNRLLLDLKAKAIDVPESYGGGGSIEAEMVAASAN